MVARRGCDGAVWSSRILRPSLLPSKCRRPLRALGAPASIDCKNRHPSTETSIVLVRGVVNQEPHHSWHQARHVASYTLSARQFAAAPRQGPGVQQLAAAEGSSATSALTFAATFPDYHSPSRYHSPLQLAISLADELAFVRAHHRADRRLSRMRSTSQVLAFVVPVAASRLGPAARRWSHPRFCRGSRSVQLKGRSAWRGATDRFHRMQSLR